MIGNNFLPRKATINDPAFRAALKALNEGGQDIFKQYLIQNNIVELNLDAWKIRDWNEYDGFNQNDKIEVNLNALCSSLANTPVKTLILSNAGRKRDIASIVSLLKDSNVTELDISNTYQSTIDYVDVDLYHRPVAVDRHEVLMDSLAMAIKETKIDSLNISKSQYYADAIVRLLTALKGHPIQQVDLRDNKIEWDGEDGKKNILNALAELNVKRYKLDEVQVDKSKVLTAYYAANLKKGLSDDAKSKLYIPGVPNTNENELKAAVGILLSPRLPHDIYQLIVNDITKGKNKAYLRIREQFHSGSLFPLEQPLPQAIVQRPVDQAIVQRPIVQATVSRKNPVSKIAKRALDASQKVLCTLSRKSMRP